MFAPEENQIAICLLKSNLEEIENNLVEQRSAWPELDAENEQKCRDTMNILRVVRNLSAETERLNQQNVRLVARRMQLKRQSDDLIEALQEVRNNRTEIENALKLEERDIEAHICKYEENLREKALKFRKTRGYYNEEEMRGEIKKAENTITELEAEVGKRQAVVATLTRELDGLHPVTPEDLLAVIGKKDLDEKLKLLTEEHEALQLKLNELLKTK